MSTAFPAELPAERLLVLLREGRRFWHRLRVLHPTRDSLHARTGACFLLSFPLAVGEMEVGSLKEMRGASSLPSSEAWGLHSQKRTASGHSHTPTSGADGMDG